MNLFRKKTWVRPPYSPPKPSLSPSPSPSPVELLEILISNPWAKMDAFEINKMLLELYQHIVDLETKVEILWAGPSPSPEDGSDHP